MHKDAKNNKNQRLVNFEKHILTQFLHYNVCNTQIIYAVASHMYLKNLVQILTRIIYEFLQNCLSNKIRTIFDKGGS